MLVRNLLRWALCLLLPIMVGGLGLSKPSVAASYEFTSQASERPLTVVANQTIVLEFAADIGQAIVGDPGTADVLPISGRVMYLQGKRFGTTNLTVFSADKSQQIQFSVQVTPDVAALKRTFAAVAPGVDVKIITSGGRIILTGEVPDAPTADRLALVAKDFTENVTNAMVIRSGQQVMLEVWFLEVRRGASKELGVSLSGNNGDFSGSSTPVRGIGAGAVTGGATAIISGVNISARIDALEARSLGRQLANPNLVAISGKKAYFNSGGKVPYSSQSGLNASNTQFVNYGVNLSFVPTVLNNGVINLEVAAGVSALDTKTYGISDNPGIIERVTETAVELRNGEALMIAGLTNAEMLRNIEQTPGLGDLPILGALFRSSDFKNSESELVIIISPHIVDGVKNLSSFQSPLNRRRLTDEGTFFLQGKEEMDRDVVSQVRATAKKASGSKAAPQGHMMDDEGAQ